MTPTILSLQPVNEGGLRAYVSVRLGKHLVVHRVRWVQAGPGVRPYAQPPMEVTTGADGRKRYTPLLEWPAEWRESITEAILETLRDHPAGLRNVPATEFGQEVHRKAGIGGRS